MKFWLKGLSCTSWEITNHSMMKLVLPVSFSHHAVRRILCSSITERFTLTAQKSVPPAQIAYPSDVLVLYLELVRVNPIDCLLLPRDVDLEDDGLSF